MSETPKKVRVAITSEASPVNFVERECELFFACAISSSCGAVSVATKQSANDRLVLLT